ncbi:MAG: septal ring lytic transglycosylase RlpA family protein [Gammaproteobacteria bacterium]|nr:septal ring lytic transglycosylase RlpA family protein [Gammaproteobacteria bacterium]
MKIKLIIRSRYGLLLSLLILTSCGGVRDSAPKNYTKQWDEIPDAVPVAVKPSRYGNPDSYKVFGKTYYVKDSAQGFHQKGIASWYGNKFHGERTSSGEDYNMYAMTAAHKTLPIPVYVEVTNLDNGRKATVRVNDRGPFHEGRIIDLSYAAATKLGVAKTGTANVSIRVVNTQAEKNSQYSAALVESPLAEDGKLYVQVAAFATEENAIKNLGQLQGEGFSGVRLHIESKQGRPLYRIRIGPLPSEQVAEQVLTQLKQNNHKNLKVVKN